MSKTNDADVASIKAWFGQRLPQEWTDAGAEVIVDREEITVVINLDAPQPASGAAPTGETSGGTGEGADTQHEPTDDAAAAATAAAVAGLVARWREDTRHRRIAIAREAEHRFGRKVAWGVQVGAAGEWPREIFTHLAVPVMTRLRQPERVVLDTLVDAGVARSRSHALAWCVATVGRNAETWLSELRDAMESVERIRNQGPRS